MSPLLAGLGRASQPFLLAPGRAFVLINHPLGLSPPSSTRNLSLGAAPAAFWELATHWVAWRGGDPVPGGRRNQVTVLINHFCHLQTSFGVGEQQESSQGAFSGGGRVHGLPPSV